MEIAVVGPGRLGLQLAAALGERGFTVRLVRGRRPVPARTRALVPGITFDTWETPAAPLAGSTVVLTVPDREIARTAEMAAAEGTPAGTVVLHTSGLHTSRELEPCRAAGAAAASWHPLAAFPPLAVARAAWRGVWTAIEGDPGAAETARRLAEALGCTPWAIRPEAKPLYHAAAALAANLTHVLAAEAARLAARCGLEDPAAALAPLVQSSVAAALRHPDLSALTGPVVRGDAGTLARHLDVLPPELGEIYRRIAELVRTRVGAVAADTLGDR